MSRFIGLFGRQMANTQLAEQTRDFDADASEGARLEALAHYEILDTPSEPVFDRIARLIQNIFDTPIAMVTLIDGHRQWYKAGFGLANSEVPLSQTFCRYLLIDSKTLVIPDATRDDRVSQNPMVTGEPHIRFYAGAPLITPDGHTIGTVCAIDTKPRELTSRETEILADLGRLAMDAMELRRLASIDQLTTSLSRRAFLEAGRSLFALARRHGETLSAIAIDLDHFKSINDTYGHATGDAVLRTVAQACRRTLGDADLFGRMGGEEFVALLPQTNAAGALETAERLRAAVQELDIPYGRRTIGVTASFGVASLDASLVNLDALIDRADTALYTAKSGGRNQSIDWQTGAMPLFAAPNEPSPMPGSRRRVLKAGRLSFGNDKFTVDCTVKTLGENGAGIDVSSTLEVPDRFDLVIPADGLRRSCKVANRSQKHLEVAFA